MNFSQIRSIDLNLLAIAAALYTHRNVSKAAGELGLSQSAVSHALSRLRDMFDDPLFVRTAQGMSTTEYAKKIQPMIMDLLTRAESLVTKKASFDPATDRSRITLASTDYFEAVAMPRLQRLLSTEAPHLQLSLRPTIGELPKRDLEEGRVDLAIAGFYRDLPEGFYQSKLYTDHFSCAVGQSHALYKAKELTADQYFEARHALITLQGDFRQTQKGRQREICYGTYSFTGMAWVLQQSQLLLTAPTQLVEAYREYFPIKIWPCPVDKGTLDIRMVWHSQTHEDPARIWIRQKIKEVCSEILSKDARIGNTRPVNRKTAERKG